VKLTETERLILRNQHALMYALSSLKVGSEGLTGLYKQMVDTNDVLDRPVPRKRKRKGPWKPPLEAWKTGSGNW
jgi:hypothetical protein